MEEYKLAEIGGILVLCFGASFFTLSEIVELIFFLVYVQLFPKKVKEAQDANQDTSLIKAMSEAISELKPEIQKLKKKKNTLN